VTPGEVRDTLARSLRAVSEVLGDLRGLEQALATDRTLVATRVATIVPHAVDELDSAETALAWALDLVGGDGPATGAAPVRGELR
jgi:hypothetical protein